MEKISVIFDKFIQRNEKTGESTFIARIKALPVKCCGEVFSYPKNAPLSLTGEYETVDGKKLFRISDCHIEDGEESSIHTFLSDGKFNGVGSAVANIITSTLDEGVIYSLKNNSLSDAMDLFKSNRDVIYRCLLQIKNIVDFEEVHDYLKTLGCSYYNAFVIYEKFGKDSKERILNNPYILRYADTSFEKCEEIAKREGIKYYDDKRIRALVETAMDYNHDSGNTRMPFDKLCELTEKLENKGGFYKTKKLFVAKEIVSDRYILEDNRDLFVYKKSDYDNEMEIIRNIRRISLGSRAVNDITPIRDIEAELCVEYSDEQRQAFDAIKTTGIKIITGGPGTGKTTLENGLLKKYEADNKNKEIVLCAPTGCAARKMSEHTGRQALTIHKLLGICPYDGEETKSRVDMLTADCIVVDECSMIDNEIMALLLKSVKSDALVLMLGDKDQLPPVNAGNSFADMIESGEVESYELKKIFRQKGKSLIVSNSRKVINGDPDLDTDKSFSILRYENEGQMVEKAKSISDKCRARGITDIKFYTPSRNRKFATGTIRLNQMLKIKASDESITYGPYTFSVGDRVIFNRNNYDKGYFNGEEGKITYIQKNSADINIKILTDDGAIFLKGTELSDIELAYAITAHKAQGSECRNAVIIIPKKPMSMLKRQLLYVEITRAKENVMILSEGNALEEAISSKFEFERNTGLIEKLRSA